MFSIDNNTATGSTGFSRLEGNKIHNVKLADVKAATIGTDTKYDVVTVRFEGIGDSEGGVFTDTIFPPQMPQDGQRTKNNFGGENPSRLEELQAKIRHYIAAFNPQLSAEIQSGVKKVTAPDWNSLRQVIVSALTPGVGVETQLKLLKNSKGEPILPGYFLSINKDNALYMRTSFVGSKLTFTPKEVERITLANTAAPTDMSSASSIASGVSLTAGNSLGISLPTTTEGSEGGKSLAFDISKV